MNQESTSVPREEFTIELPPGGVRLAEVERHLVRQAMEQAGGNRTRAAELLGIRRDALRRRLVKYGLFDSGRLDRF